MTEMTSYDHGVPCWTDLGTTDQESAKAFYTGLFGWESREDPAPQGTYTTFTLGGKNVAACYQTAPEQAAGMPPMWTTYVAVDDVEAVAPRIVPAGGTLMGEPFDVMEAGRMVLAADPGGAVFGLWQAKEHAGAEIVNEPGALTWNELATRDPDTAAAFYAEALGWTARRSEVPMEYWEFLVGDRSVGGMMRMTEQWPPDAPPHWVVYFAVSDCDATTTRAEVLGGKIAVPPMDIPVGRFAFLTDPQGGAFAVITLTEAM